MRWRFVLAAVLLVPLVEIAVFIGVSQATSVGWALLATLATTVPGVVVLRREGRRSLQRFREAMDSGKMPGNESSNGALRMAGGIALVIPGFVTDLVGLLLLLPPTRALLRGMLFRGFVRRVSPETANQMFGPRQVRVRRGKPDITDTRPASDGDVIEGEVIDVAPRPAPDRPPE
ncbi:MAG: FxsA family protein [Micromonosporaceae bacterium]